MVRKVRSVVRMVVRFKSQARVRAPQDPRKQFQTKGRLYTKKPTHKLADRHIFSIMMREGGDRRQCVYYTSAYLV